MSWREVTARLALPLADLYWRRDVERKDSIWNEMPTRDGLIRLGLPTRNEMKRNALTWRREPFWTGGICLDLPPSIVMFCSEMDCDVLCGPFLAHTEIT